jgi:hypothetical protein
MSSSLRFVLRRVGHVSIAWFLVSSLAACQRRVPPPAAAPAPKPALAATPPAQAQSGAPAIDFDTRVHDFGQVNEGNPLKHVFQVKNQGTASLVLSNVRTSCGCTAAIPGVTTLPPGGSGPLEVTMDTHGFVGPGTKRIMVSSNDPRQPTATLEIKYDVERLLGLDRSFVQLTTPRGSKHVEKVWLTGQLVKQARLRIVEVKGGEVVAARVIESREGGQLRKGLELKLGGKKPASGEGALTIQTGLPNVPDLSLPFRYEVN